ncbi:hypothetical protein BGZ61DRAFT_369428 [Ilyonectria robusta]|uniref:uncharacterized protein n=1 Tax=Ilyonectria robusta TaxID=1079257 RepID=UPI001E8D3156|nr:uncharacterized protein BGZ61DRAFT_369428 [Ilyonectria robusta]KAH8661187.1 hypothetical protein BGZ61DRAFT_369428 [Ilyonectria robusta]
MSESPPPTPKRRRLEESTGGVDNGDVQDETPRANSSWTGLPGGVPEASASPTKRQNRRRAHRTHTASPIPSLSSQSESQSYTSGRSSPTKRLATLELNHDGIETRVMSLTNPLLPETLAEILSELEFCSNGLGVVSRSCKDEIQAQAQANRSFSLFRDFMYADPETRDTLGPTPSVPDVMWILEEARECQDTMQSESGWNMGVHFPLLHKAIYGQRRQKQLVGVAACTTAKIIKEYLPCDSPAKMVDFSIYLAPDAGPLTNETKAAVDAISSLRRVLPCGVINHTDFFPLRSRSMVVSIETKKRGGAQQEAELQIGTWHTAQWKFLSRLVSDAGGTFDGLPFLPGIVVQGHEWSFVATTREGPKTILWLEQGFGSTTTALGVYKIVWGLQRIARWAEDVYWPWFKKNALGV